MKSKQKWNRFVKIWLVLGLVMAIFINLDLKVYGKSATCSYCHGTGRADGGKCPWCGGSGKTYDNYFNDILGGGSGKSNSSSDDTDIGTIVFGVGCVIILILWAVYKAQQTQQTPIPQESVGNQSSEINKNQWTCINCGTINSLSNTCYACGSKKGVVSEKKGTISGWRCQCGAINAPYIGTCKCGRSKSDPVPEKEMISQPQVIQELDKTDEKITGSSNATKFEEIKEYKALLDSGVISQEEFEKKKKELLGL